MGTWLSQPRQFNAYTPEVDPDLYAKVLMKKEQDYQKGIQNVQAIGQSIASLPVANVYQRQYLQEKLNNITSKINESTGINWSDRSVQKMTAGHISAIADDPIIQNAVQQTVALKRDYNLAKEGHDLTDGKDIANQEDFNKSMTNYINNPDPNARYSGRYHTFQDADKLIHDHMINLHPDLDKRVFSAGEVDPATGKTIPVTGWDKIIRTYKGVDRDKVLQELDQFIATTPGLKTQLDINADYITRNTEHNYMPDYVQSLRKQQYGELKGLKSYSSQLSQRLALTKDPLEKARVSETYSKLKITIDNMETVLAGSVFDNVAAMSYDRLTPEQRQVANRELYLNTFKTEKSNLYSWSEKSEDFEGKSPYEKKWSEHDRVFDENEKLKADNRADRQLKLNEDAGERESNKTSTTSTGLGEKHKLIIDIGGLKPNDQPLDYLNHESLINDNIINQSKLVYINTILDDPMRKKLITVRDGNYSINNTKVADPDTGNEISASDYINKLYNKKIAVYNSGNYNSIIPGAVKLDVRDIDALSNIKIVSRENEAIKARLGREESIWKDHLKDLSKKYGISENDLNAYTTIANKLRSTGDTNEIDASSIPGSTLPKIPEQLRQELEKHNDFITNSLKSAIPIHNSWETLLTGGKEEVNKEVIGAVQAIIAARTKKGTGIMSDKVLYPIAAKILSGKNESAEPKNISVGYWTDENTGQVNLRVQDGKVFEDVPINSEQAIALKFNTRNPYKTVQRILDLNDNNGTSNTGESNIMTWENAFPKGQVLINKSPSELRVHYERTNNGIYPHIYIRTSNGKTSNVDTQVLNAVPTLEDAEYSIQQWMNRNNK